MDTFFAAPQTRNAAVKIVAPPSSSENTNANASQDAHQPQKSIVSPKKDTTQRQCRNIMIHGYCKYEGKGCMYHHPPKEEPVPEQDTFSFESQEEADGNGNGATNSTFPLQAVNAPVFVPRTLTSPQKTERMTNVYTPPPYSGAYTYESSEYSPTSVAPGRGSMDGLAQQVDQLVFSDYGDNTDEQLLLQQDYDALPPVDPFFQPQPFIRHSLNYHLYTLPLPSPSSSEGRKFFISDQIREELLRRSEQIHMGPIPALTPGGSVPMTLPGGNVSSGAVSSISGSGSRSGMSAPGSVSAMSAQGGNISLGVSGGVVSGLPEEVQGYHSLVPLEFSYAGMDRKKMGGGLGVGMGMNGAMGGGWPSVVYKAIKSGDGRAYALRRVENFRLMNEQAFSVVEKWSKIRHPGIVSVHEAFTTRAFGDNSLVVVYDYHPNSSSLAELHFQSSNRSNGFSLRNQNQGQVSVHSSNATATSGHGRLDRIPEQTLWSYIFQIASAMRAVHDAGLAVRMVDASKILCTGQNRVRISSCAIFDVLLFDTRQEPLLLQQEDMIMFAKLIMSLACNNPSAVRDVHKSLDHVHRYYPGNIKDVIHYLMKTPGPMKNIHGLFETFGGKLVLEMDAAHATIDKLEGELMGELENARLVRLLCKFGFINERPEFDRDPRWSETGDRYIIKLFRDYVFHSVDENGNPVVNLAHVLTNLNKLDAGSEERLMLVSRDEQSCLVATYREIKKCIDDAFGDLTRNR